MEKLSRTLQTEKDLLESLIPQHAAEGLRKGKTVEPMQHSRVTMFFSDVVGFTNICEHLAPTEIIDMLNKLYGIMDFLAKKFALFKIETIGDAYVCCSGLPDSDDDHAINVANFAIAVQHCCQRVRSPLDGSPIQLRVGINSGSCASGIVGVTNPRYCVFGDVSSYYPPVCSFSPSSSSTLTPRLFIFPFFSLRL
jgi:class 3 adenylate cyclase